MEKRPPQKLIRLVPSDAAFYEVFATLRSGHHFGFFLSSAHLSYPGVATCKKPGRREKAVIG
ncbi:hypothetical protein JG687_00011605 [Phytophthora cactorum]|uniref:Uncharacterized protein n=1 Tax=Phytophthora cactorum TaxID=29920 RepID=A0A329RWZ9_9STRA|nr:hypothetical protein PC111_g11818 [Phytophthora cactorum]KAG2854008.1 hypothetical protein PC113_g13682 [Phytophthora cactorum]KAG2911001.1 hypothetical protein PC115_g12700 [Phytophthora cactorum]KAG2912039.1 hypothetical protein PC114_g9087 [Phytophthora cactorum]KAG2929020.1 hypothetical protein PC117_g14123 [Phytophthora cactorum]